MLSRVWCSRALMLAAVLATLTGARSMLLVERLVPASCSSHSHSANTAASMSALEHHTRLSMRAH